MKPAASPSPRFALALGGGGARGLAHIPMLEAFDELGIRPVALAGTSMGAIVAAAYASGTPASAIREVALATLGDRRGMLGTVMAARSGRLTDLFSGLGNPMTIDAERLCAGLLHETVAARFEDCRVPLTVVATDFYGRREVAFRSGPLHRAVAASIAIPGLFRPVEMEGRVLVDGGAVNPLPVDHVQGAAECIVAVDVTGGPAAPPGGTEAARAPGSWETMFGTLQILQAGLVEDKLRRCPADILVRPDVDLFRVLDFFKASVIFRMARPAKEELKRQLSAVLEQAAKGGPAKG